MTLNLEIIELLKKEGCNIVGFADLRIFPEDVRKGSDVGIIMGIPYTPKAVQDKIKDVKIPHGSLERYNEAVSSFLKEKGYKRNKTYSKMTITYKMLAALAGIGWVGRCALLTTKDLGPALRFTALLTNAPLECGTPITKSLCPPDCSACADICPANAVKTGLWERGVHRDEFFDVNACKKGRSQCHGLCISICPYTQKGFGYV